MTPFSWMEESRCGPQVAAPQIFTNSMGDKLSTNGALSGGRELVMAVRSIVALVFLQQGFC